MYGTFDCPLGYIVYENDRENIIGIFFDNKNRDDFFRRKITEKVRCDKASGEIIETDSSLKPCPFCKNKKDVSRLLVRKDLCKETDSYFVECTYCRARGSYSSTVKGAKKNWNRRHP